MKGIPRGSAGLSVLLAVAFAASPAPAQETFRLAGERVSVYNLAGRVDVVRGTGSDVVVRVTRGGADAGRLEVLTGPIDGRATLRVIYPAERVVYPALGRGSRTTRTVSADGTFGGGRDAERVTIAGAGEGLEAFADLRIEVPDGRDLAVHLAAGDAEASDLRGNLTVDTGSGAVAVSRVVGRVGVDTGSGSVRVRDVQGDLLVDTGSGSVAVDGAGGERVVVDTGSGDVRASGLSAGSVRVETGSGHVRLDGLRSADVSVDTGSGSVDLDLLEAVSRLLVDTGSGSVTVRFAVEPSADIEVETGSGAIEVDFPMQLRTMRRDHVVGRIGSGEGSIRIDTGSGGVRLLRR